LKYLCDYFEMCCLDYIFHERIQFLTVNLDQASLKTVPNLHSSTTIFDVQFVKYVISNFDFSLLWRGSHL
jgi:hypothetical protein